MRDQPPFRADHVGSLLRPPLLLAARAEHAEGRLDDAGLRDVEDAGIRELVASNLCRCTGYRNIVRAIHAAAKERD